MTGGALALVLAAAFIHAGWNYVLKKSGGGIGLLTAASVWRGSLDAVRKQDR